MRRWEEGIIDKVVAKRKAGATYSQLIKEFGIPKSTLSDWFKDIPKPAHLCFTNREEWLKQIRVLSALAIKKKRSDEVELIANRAKDEVKKWNFLGDINTQKTMLALLYWAEGQKLPDRGAPVRFANTDPRLVLLFLTMLRRCYGLDNKKLKIKLHLHWYHSVIESKKFWGDLLEVDQSMFEKIYLKKRSQNKRFRRNFMGICFVTYFSVDLRQEIMHTAYNIQQVVTGKSFNYMRS